MKKEMALLSFVLIFGILAFGTLVLADNSTNATNSSSVNTSMTDNSTDSNVTTTIDTTIDSETENELEVIKTTSIGPEVRVLQLKRSIGIKIIQGERIIEYIKANKTDENTTKLESIIKELKVLNESTDEIPTDNKTEAVKSFVDIKLQARDLIKKFREEALRILDISDRESLRAMVNEIENKSLIKIRERIRERQRELWKEQVAYALGKFGFDDQKLRDDVMNASMNMTAERIRERLKERFENMTEEEKNLAKERLRNGLMMKVEERNKALVEAEDKIKERIAEKEKQRMESLKEKGP